MGRFSRLNVLNQMQTIGIIPIFYNSDPSTAIEIVKACAKGGAYVIEMTNRGDAAIEVFKEVESYCKQHLPKVTMGIGSIVDPYTATTYINYGANFVVGPSFDKDTAIACNKRKIPYTPGCGSVTEIQQAHAFGVEIIKLFPGSQVGGPDFVKAIKKPCPWTSIMPTGGVSPTQESLSQWFKAGITCAAMGSKLITTETVTNKDWDKITETIIKVKNIISELRPN